MQFSEKSDPVFEKTRFIFCKKRDPYFEQNVVQVFRKSANAFLKKRDADLEKYWAGSFLKFPRSVFTLR